MKKFLSFLLCGLLLATAGMAQSRLTPALDTTTNAGTVYLTTGSLPGSTGNMAIQYVGTKISGTAAGTVILQGSIDGTNYKTIAAADTLTLTNVATNTHVWDVTDKKRMYYRLSITGSGTMSVQNKGYYLERK